MKSCLVCVTIAVFTTVAGAADLAILRAVVDPKSDEVSVQMSEPASKIKTGELGAKKWTVVIYDKKGTAIPGFELVDVRKAASDVVLTLKPPKPPEPPEPPVSLVDWSSVFVSYTDGDKTLHFLGTRPKKPESSEAADSKDNSDVYVKGSYSPSINSPAQYSYDVAASYGLPYFSQAYPRLSRVGFTVTAAADQRPNLNPDSYYTGLLWQPFLKIQPFGPLQGVELQLASGGEFALKKLGGTQTRTTNFIAPNPRFDFPLRLPTGSTKHVTLMLRPMVGFEYGKNFQNAHQPDGSGLIARWLVGLNTSLTYKPRKPFLHSLSLSSSWQGRYLEESEIDTTSKFNPTTQNFDFTFRLTRKPRNHVLSKLEWKWTEYLGLTVSDELGAVPPLFNYVDHSFAVGFTISAGFPRNEVHLRR